MFKKSKKSSAPAGVVSPVSEHNRSLQAILGTFYVEVCEPDVRSYVCVKRCSSYSEALQFAVGLFLSSSEPIEVIISLNASSAGRSSHHFVIDRLGVGLSLAKDAVSAYLESVGDGTEQSS